MEGENLASQEESQKNKKAFKVLFIEVFLFVFILSSSLFLLNYYGVISLKNLNPLLFGFLPQKNKESSFLGRPIPPKTVATVPIDVLAASDSPNYKLEVLEKQKLISILTSWKFFDTLIVDRDRKGDKIRELTVVLSNIELPDNRVLNKDKSVYMASDFIITGINRAKLPVYIAPNILSDPKKNGSQYVTSEALKAMYVLSHPVTSQEEYTKRENDFSEEVKKLSNTIFFKVASK